MQDSARQDTHLFSSYHSIASSDFVCLADYTLVFHNYHGSVIPGMLSADRWLDVSLVLDVVLGIHLVMMDLGNELDIPGWWICLRICSVEHACVLTNRRGSLDDSQTIQSWSAARDRCNC